MRVRTKEILPTGLNLSIIEVDNPTAIKYFNNRFLLTLEINGKTILPKCKNKFCSFETNHYFYPLKSETNDSFIVLDFITYHEKLLCDKSLKECTDLMLSYVSMSNNGQNVRKKLKQFYKF